MPYVAATALIASSSHRRPSGTIAQLRSDLELVVFGGRTMAIRKRSPSIRIRHPNARPSAKTRIVHAPMSRLAGALFALCAGGSSALSNAPMAAA